MKAVIALACVSAVSAVKFGGVMTSMTDANPPPYEVYNIAIENASPDVAATRAAAEERRAETAALNSIAEMRSSADATLGGLSAIDAMHKAKASFLQGGNAGDFPVVEVSLAGPTNPYPSVAAKIASLEKTRESMESAKLSALTTAYGSILASAKAEIVKTLGGHSSFLKLNPIEPSVMFNLVESHSDVSAAGAAIDSLESKRQAAEAQMLDSAISELGEFAKVYVAELTKNLKTRASFLHAVPSTAEGFHRQINVKLMPSESFTSVSKMVSNMEKRRDASESAIRASILDLELSMAKSLNAFAAATVRAL